MGSKKKQAEIITEEEEELLWVKGLLGDETPQRLSGHSGVLQWAIFCPKQWSRAPSASTQALPNLR